MCGTSSSDGQAECLNYINIMEGQLSFVHILENVDSVFGEYNSMRRSFPIFSDVSLASMACAVLGVHVYLYIRCDRLLMCFNHNLLLTFETYSLQSWNFLIVEEKCISNNLSSSFKDLYFKNHPPHFKKNVAGK